jgi:hypothetical protein
VFGSFATHAFTARAIGPICAGRARSRAGRSLERRLLEGSTADGHFECAKRLRGIDFKRNR